MHPRATELVTRLNLAPHLEGGYFTRAFRSDATVFLSDSRGSRSALTAIHFLLVEGTFSRWHRVSSDETWHHYEGSLLELLAVAPSWRHRPSAYPRASLRHICASSCRSVRLVAGGPGPGPYSLVGCSVGPGFEYDDFALLATIPAAERPHFDPPSLQAAFL